MRQLTAHIVKGDSVNNQLHIEVVDGLGHGGANHEYLILAPPNPTCSRSTNAFRVSFQNGPINEVGVNGITHEALLAILIDRLESFQNGPFRCDANGLALSHLRYALDALQERTRERIARSVEGTHQI